MCLQVFAFQFSIAMLTAISFMPRPRAQKPAVYRCVTHVKGCPKVDCECPQSPFYSFFFRFYEPTPEGGLVTKPYFRTTIFTTEKDAMRLAVKAMDDKLKAAQAGQRAWIDGDVSRRRRVLSKITEVATCYLERCGVWRKSCRAANGSFSAMTACDAAWRATSDLYLFGALSQDLWMVNEGGRSGVKVGARVPDKAKIGELSAGMLNAKSVRAYQLARQKVYGIAHAGAKEVALIEHEKHVGINSTLRHVWELFSEAAMRHAYEGRVKLPDMAEFMDEALLLPEPDEVREPEPFVGDVFDKLCAKFDALKKSEPNLWKLNLISRQTLLRPAFVLALSRESLVMIDGHASVAVYSRAHSSEERMGKPSQYVPITDEVLEVLNATAPGERVVGHGLPEASLVALQDRHNAIIKEIAGGRRYGQGAYRYRDTGGSVLMKVGGVKVARDALGHKKSETTLDHYAQALPAVSARQRHELRAWLPVEKVATKAKAKSRVRR